MTHAEAVGNAKRRAPAIAAAALLVVFLSPGIVAYACRRNFDGLTVK